MACIPVRSGHIGNSIVGGYKVTDLAGWPLSLKKSGPRSIDDSGMAARRPATNAKPRDESQGFSLPLSVASVRHVTVTLSGLSLPASDWRCPWISSIGLLSIFDCTYAQASPQGSKQRDSRRALCRLLQFPGSENLKHRVEGGRRPFASGTPATRGAHNSESVVQQPDHQSLIENQPEPNHRSASSWRLPRAAVKRPIAARPSNAGLAAAGVLHELERSLK